jgi:hypothetical protein
MSSTSGTATSDSGGAVAKHRGVGMPLFGSGTPPPAVRRDFDAERREVDRGRRRGRLHGGHQPSRRCGVGFIPGAQQIRLRPPRRQLNTLLEGRSTSPNRIGAPPPSRDLGADVSGSNPGSKLSASEPNSGQLEPARDSRNALGTARTFRLGAGRSQVQILSPRSNPPAKTEAIDHGALGRGYITGSKCGSEPGSSRSRRRALSSDQRPPGSWTRAQFGPRAGDR